MTNDDGPCLACGEYGGHADGCVLAEGDTATTADAMEVRHPEITVQLTGVNGNAFAVMGAVTKALKRSGHSDEVDEFVAEATSGDYDHLLQTCMKWVDVS